MKPWIQNVSQNDIRAGLHRYPEVNTTLIQIANPGAPFVVSKFVFREVFKFEFSDTINPAANDTISKAQAREITDILLNSLDENVNILVHSDVGLSRAGAICEVGIMLGFKDTQKIRVPNIYVKQMLINELGNNSR
jgi:predicted protein tyrosine phosphatase